jgi:hypothetical protein
MRICRQQLAVHGMRQPLVVVRCCNLGMIVLAPVVIRAPPLFIPFREACGLTYEQLGRLVLVNFTTQVTLDLLCGALSDRLPPRIFVLVNRLRRALSPP